MAMKISLIVAASLDDVIGKGEQLPWRLPNDLRYFKKMTVGHHVLMGRKTYDSLGKYKPLPDRINMVITRQEHFNAPGCEVFRDIQSAIAYAKAAGEEELFIIGGGTIYSTCIEMADRIYLTRVHTTIEAGDTHFPKINANEWELVSLKSHSINEKHVFAYDFQLWERY